MGRLLDEDAVIKVLELWQKAFRENSHYVSASDLSLVVKDVRELPTAQPERAEGEWLPDNNNAYEMRFVCSCCKESEVVPTIGFIKYKPIWDFCPNCGAKMKGE